MTTLTATRGSKGRSARRRLGLAGAGAALALLLGGAGAVVALGPLPLSAWLHHPSDSFLLARGENPNPVRLKRPPAAPLSALALLGRQVFFDARLSSSGKLSCASCHDPATAYGPPADLPAMLGGPDLMRQGVRAVPSLMYLERQSPFSVGPDDEETEGVSLAVLADAAQGAARAQKTATDTEATAANLVPQGGLFWDGRVNTLQQQATFPLLSQFEMDGGSIDTVAAKLREGDYAPSFVELFGPSVLKDANLLVAEAMSAVARYQIEDPDFHPYSSKFDAWLEGRARLTPTELRGYLLFNDPARANCGGCHLDLPSPDGLPPRFTDTQYEALGAPRNPALAANRDPAYFDLGVCGPYRTDMAEQTQYCGMFLTPTLRNTATRRVFFHNGVFRTLQQVMDFYDFRDVDPGRVYPKAADGKPDKFDDIPPQLRANADVADPPFDRHPGEAPAMTAQDERDIIAFLGTLTDGYYQPGAR